MQAPRSVSKGSSRSQWKLSGFRLETRGPFLESPSRTETSCVRTTSLHIKDMWIKQLCNHEVWDLLWLSGCKFFGTVERQVTGLEILIVESLTRDWWLAIRIRDLELEMQFHIQVKIPIICLCFQTHNFNTPYHA